MLLGYEITAAQENGSQLQELHILVPHTYL